MNKLVQEISTNSKAAVSVLNSMSTKSKKNIVIKSKNDDFKTIKKIIFF